LDEECENLLNDYKASGDPDIADHLIESLDSAKRKRWEESTANLDFTHSSRKCWNLIRRLGTAQQPVNPSCPAVSPNAVATHLVRVGNTPVDKTHQRSVRNEWRQFCRQKLTGQQPETTVSFQSEDLAIIISKLKTGTAAGYDNTFRNS